MINFFKQLNDYDKYFESQLALSGTILGLIVATSTFILQSGFTSFQYSRSMFVKYYVHQNKFIFLSLTYNILFSIIILYLNVTPKFLYFIHLFFSLVFSKYFLDFYSHKGYIITIHSEKFNPHKKGLLRYFRYIINLGLFQNIIAYGTIYILFFYPMHFNEPYNFNNHQVYMTTLSCLVFSVLVIIRIIPQFFDFSEQEYKSKTKNELIDTIDIDITKENIILKELLIKNGRKELKEPLKTSQFENIFVSLPENKREAFFVINVKFSDKNIYEIISSIENYSYEFFIELSNTHVDVNNFVLSYNIKIDQEEKSRSYFIRASRNEIDELKFKSFKEKEFISKIKNKVIDGLFRNI